jgi:hypothetical protein
MSALSWWLGFDSGAVCALAVTILAHRYYLGRWP